jgi:hypothetical protein
MDVLFYAPTPGLTQEAEVGLDDACDGGLMRCATSGANEKAFGWVATSHEIFPALQEAGWKS